MYRKGCRYKSSNSAIREGGTRWPLLDPSHHELHICCDPYLHVHPVRVFPPPVGTPPRPRTMLRVCACHGLFKFELMYLDGSIHAYGRCRSRNVNSRIHLARCKRVLQRNINLPRWFVHDKMVCVLSSACPSSATLCPSAHFVPLCPFLRSFLPARTAGWRAGGTRISVLIHGSSAEINVSLENGKGTNLTPSNSCLPTAWTP